MLIIDHLNYTTISAAMEHLLWITDPQVPKGLVGHPEDEARRISENLKKLRSLRTETNLTSLFYYQRLKFFTERIGQGLVGYGTVINLNSFFNIAATFERFHV